MGDACNVDKRVKTNLRLRIKEQLGHARVIKQMVFEEIDAPDDASTLLVTKHLD